MYRKKTIAVATAAVLVGLTCTAGGCGSKGSSGSHTAGATKIEVQGNPGGAHQCKMTLRQHLPVAKQLVATLTVTCNFPLISAYTTLVIQGRPLGGDGTQWDNLSDPVSSADTTSITLTYKIPCITSLEYQSSASIDASGADGSPVHADQTTTPRSYDASECTQGK